MENKLLKRDYKVKNKYYNEWVHTRDLPLKSGDRESVLTWLYKSNLVPWYSTYLLEKPYENERVQDLIGELYLILSEIPEERWLKLFEQGKFAVSGYVTGVIKQQLVSSTSAIYHKYYKHYAKEKIMDEEFWNLYEEEH